MTEQQEKPQGFELRDNYKNGDTVKIKGGPDLSFRLWYKDVIGERQGWYLSHLTDNDRKKKERWRQIKEFLNEKRDTPVAEFSPYLRHRYNEFTEKEQHLINAIEVYSYDNDIAEKFRYYINIEDIQYQVKPQEVPEILAKLQVDSVEQIQETKDLKPALIWRIGFWCVPVFLLCMFITLLGCGWAEFVDGEPERTWAQWLAVALVTVMALTGWGMVPMLKAASRDGRLCHWDDPHQTPRDMLWNNMGLFFAGFLVSALLVFIPNYLDWVLKETYVKDNMGAWWVFIVVPALALYPFWLVQQVRLLFFLDEDTYFANTTKTSALTWERKRFLTFYGLYDRPEKIKEFLRQVEKQKEDDKIRSKREEQAGCCNWACPFASRQAADLGVDRQEEGVGCPDFLRCKDVKKARPLQGRSNKVGIG